MKKLLLAMIPIIGLAGCSAVGQLNPAITNDITVAYNAICAPGGLLTAAQPFAANPTVAVYLNDATVLCASGVPTNEVTAGIDIFNLYLDLSTALHNKSAMAHAKMLKARHHG